MNRILFIILLWFSLAATLAAETMQVEVIPLQNRTVEDVIPVIRPLITDGGTVTGVNNQLIIKTTAGNLEEIKAVLASIDRAARRLVIYVRQDVDTDTHLDSHSLSGRYKDGNVSVSSDNGRRIDRGTSVTVGERDGNNVTYRNVNTRSRDEDSNLYHVQTLEGRAAFIQSGESVPFANQSAFVTRDGVVVQDTIEYRDINSGFYVLPQVSGDRVTLLISPRLASLDRSRGGVVDIQNVETTVSGRLDEWISVGGLDRNSSNNNRRNFSSTRSDRQEYRNIELKVVELP